MKTQFRRDRPYFRSFYRGNRLLWISVMILTILGSLGNLMFSWLLKEAVDVIHTRDLSWLMTLLAIGTITLVTLTCLDFMRLRLRAIFLRRAVGQYKALAFEDLAKKSISAFSRENTARYLSVLTTDIQTIEENYLISTFNIVFWSLIALGSGVMLFWYGGALAWVCIGFSLIPILLSVAMGGEMTRRTKAVSDGNAHFVAQVKDLLSGFSLLKSFKAESQAARLFNTASSEAERLKLRSRWWDNLLSIMQETCSVILQFGVVFVGGYMAIQGKMTAGTAVVMINLCGQMINPLAALPQALAARKAAAGLVSKLAEITGENAQQTGEAVPAALETAIDFQHVSYSYEPGKPVLKDVSLRLEAGKRYAIVGASGSGKSTLLNLLMGSSADYEGTITLDGRELRTIDPNSLYDLMGLIGQNVFLFDDTIRQNITMFRDFPEEQVLSAMTRAGLMPVVTQKGQDYRCGENGNGLSGGERQRLSIARSLLRGTPVLLLDEATAALDNQTAFEVTQAILDLEGLTRILVTHRLEEAVLQRFDRIFVLREGKLREAGTFPELMEKKGYFYSLYQIAN